MYSIRGEIILTRAVGTVVRGLRGPIINKGDNIEQIVVDTVLNAAKIEGFSIEDRDIVTITESDCRSCTRKLCNN